MASAKTADSTLESEESAATRVFAITELAEAIFQNLPILDLLCAQRVSKAFQGIIKGSKLLQQALFYEPVFGQSAVFERTPSKDAWDLETWVQVIGDEDKEYKVVANPVYTMLSKAYPFDNLEWWNAMKRPEASWRKMLICQPPTDNLPVNFEYEWFSTKLENWHGPGVLVEQVESVWEFCIAFPWGRSADKEELENFMLWDQWER